MDPQRQTPFSRSFRWPGISPPPSPYSCQRKERENGVCRWGSIRQAKHTSSLCPVGGLKGGYQFFLTSSFLVLVSPLSRRCLVWGPVGCLVSSFQQPRKCHMRQYVRPCRQVSRGLSRLLSSF